MATATAVAPLVVPQRTLFIGESGEANMRPEGRRDVRKNNMPASFDNCVRRGGKVRTKTLSNGRYIHLCFRQGKSYRGEVKTKKK